MNTKQKVLLSVLIVVAAIVVFYASSKAITQFTGHTLKDFNYDNFAKCLSEKNVRMYGAFWCGHCQNEKKSFGNGDLAAGTKIMIDNNLYIECDPRGENPQQDLCLEKKIQGYPTWEVNGKLIPGEIGLEELSKLTNCELN